MSDIAHDQPRNKAHGLMEEALSILDKTGDNQAAILLDHAIAILGLRPEGMIDSAPSDEI